jgi:Mg-chelatase subunit ChlI
MAKKYTSEDIYKTVEKVWELNVNPEIKKIIFNELIWKLTEIDGKYNTKYRSEEAKDIKDKKQLHHEHIISRKKLKEELVNAENKNELRKILDKSESCVITRKEHEKLNHKKEGKSKYGEAGIKLVKYK